MKPIAFSERALNVAHNQPLPADFFINPKTTNRDRLVIAETPRAIFVITPQCTPEQRLLVFRRSPKGLFGGLPADERRQVYDRAARVALRQFGEPVQLNFKWMVYHHNSFISMFAYSGSDHRLVFDTSPLGRNDVYACALSDSPEVLDLANLEVDYKPFAAAIEDFPKVCGRSYETKSAEPGQIDLDDVLPADFSNHLTYAQWYPKNLSNQQLEFVDHKITGPLRLRGAAGTGKTLAMVIKALKTAYDAHDSGQPCRILFTTHSWAGAELIDQVVRRIDDRDIFSAGSDVSLDIFPLLTLAEESRSYSAIGRRPLGIDSSDGKKRSLSEISEVICQFIETDWVTFKSGCSPSFIGRMEGDPSSREHRIFAWDILVEFGCVLAAQGILAGAADLQKYLRVRRMRWMMPLENGTEKQVVFSLWVRFLRALKSKSLIASDQIISDYLNELGTFYWEAARPARGYDYIFVDEMHLFNHQERLIFHNLLADSEIPPRVIMAMDPKQSPRETFAEVFEDGDVESGNIYQQARLPNPERIDLSAVFRYSPEIEQVIRDINEFAPALDLPSDWEMSPPTTSTQRGDIPQLYIVEDQLAAFRKATSLARTLAKAHARDKERVAILCLDDERFNAYIAAFRQIEHEAVAITSRDDTERLRFSGRKYVLSAPEYVAGLQFSTVILVDVNKGLVPEGNYAGLHLRRLLSEMYLGISRAEKRLYFITTRDAGGVSPILERSISSGHVRVG